MYRSCSAEKGLILNMFFGLYIAANGEKLFLKTVSN